MFLLVTTRVTWHASMCAPFELVLVSMRSGLRAYLVVLCRVGPRFERLTAVMGGMQVGCVDMDGVDVVLGVIFRAVKTGSARLVVASSPAFRATCVLFALAVVWLFSAINVRFKGWVLNSSFISSVVTLDKKLVLLW